MCVYMHANCKTVSDLIDMEPSSGDAHKMLLGSLEPG